MTEVKLFVYGTLMKGFRNYERYFESADVISVERAYTNGTLYHLNRKACPALVEGKQKIWGELIKFNDDKDLTFLKRLDNLEEYFENSNEVMYERKKATVFLENGEKEEAYVYFYVNNKNMNKYEPLLVPSGDWKRFMLSSAK